MAYKITGIITLYKENQNNTISIAINGDIKSPDGKNLLFKDDNNSKNTKTDEKSEVVMFKVDNPFTIPDGLKCVISLLFINHQKATFLVDDNCKNIEGVEIKQP